MGGASAIDSSKLLVTIETASPGRSVDGSVATSQMSCAAPGLQQPRALPFDLHLIVRLAVSTLTFLFGCKATPGFEQQPQCAHVSAPRPLQSTREHEEVETDRRIHIAQLVALHTGKKHGGRANVNSLSRRSSYINKDGKRRRSTPRHKFCHSGVTRLLKHLVRPAEDTVEIVSQAVCTVYSTASVCTRYVGFAPSHVCRHCSEGRCIGVLTHV